MFTLLSRCASGIALLGVFSAVVAALQFVVPLYMMAIYNRILQTQSIETLQLISLIAVVLLCVMGLADMARSRLLSMIAARLSTYLNEDVYRAILAAPGSVLRAEIGAAPDAPRSEPLQDLRVVNGFISSGALNVFFDAVFSPVFLMALFILHPLLGMIGLIAGGLIFALAVASELVARGAIRAVKEEEGRVSKILEDTLSQHDAVAAMGLGPGLYQRWLHHRETANSTSLRSQTVVATLSGLAKTIRLCVQMGVLGIGAYLVLTTDTFLAGAIIAASIILGRALAPIDQSIALWRNFVLARQSAARLVQVMHATKNQQDGLDLGKPKATVNFDQVDVGYANLPAPFVSAVDLTLGPGTVLGVLGPNGAGKTSFLKTLLGIEPSLRGSVLLGSFPVQALSDKDRNRWIGFLPQDVQLLPGTLAENVARFQEPDSDALAYAVERSGAEQVIQTVPMGLSTPYSAGLLSSGQKQLIGLARAAYGAPVLMVLDEPTANLDAKGREAVVALIKERSAQNLLTVFASHDPVLLGQASQILQIAPDGKRGTARFGDRDKMLRMMSGAVEK